MISSNGFFFRTKTPKCQMDWKLSEGEKNKKENSGAEEVRATIAITKKRKTTRLLFFLTFAN